MSRPGRELEELVAGLERFLTEEGFIVRSPDHVLDYATGGQREVDVSIRGKVGTHEILIVLECRDREHPQDVTWIEQLVTKKNDIRANLMVALSPTDFSEQAILAAKAHGIKLRSLTPYTIEELDGLISKDIRLQLIEHNIQVIKCLFDCEGDISSIPGKYNGADKLLIIEKTGIELTIGDFMVQEDNFRNHLFFRGVEINGCPVTRNILFRMASPEHIVLFKGKDKCYRIKRMKVTAEFRIISRSMPFSKARTYYEGQEKLANLVQFQTNTLDGRRLVLTIKEDVKKKLGNISIKWGEGE